MSTPNHYQEIARQSGASNNHKTLPSVALIALIAFVLLLLLCLGIWQFNRGWEKQEILAQFDQQQSQSIKTMAQFNDFNNLDAPPPIFTHIKIKGEYSQNPQDIVWIERFTEFKATNQSDDIAHGTTKTNLPINSNNPNKISNAAKAPHYLLIQKLYIEKTPNNIRPIWVWRGRSERILSVPEIQTMPIKIEKAMRVIPRIPQILTLGENCYPFRSPLNIDLNAPIIQEPMQICQNFDHETQHAKFVMMDMAPDSPLQAVESIEKLKAHFVKISPQRHFAYGTTWLALALAIIFIIIYRILKIKK